MRGGAYARCALAREWSSRGIGCGTSGLPQVIQASPSYQVLLRGDG